MNVISVIVDIQRNIPSENMGCPEKLISIK